VRSAIIQSLSIIIYLPSFFCYKPRGSKYKNNKSLLETGITQAVDFSEIGLDYKQLDKIKDQIYNILEIYFLLELS
jgi:hypothetical protein